MTTLGNRLEQTTLSSGTGIGFNLIIVAPKKKHEKVKE